MICQDQDNITNMMDQKEEFHLAKRLEMENTEMQIFQDPDSTILPKIKERQFHSE